MDTSNWRARALLEPRGFIRLLEMIMAIVAFATTGGYSGYLTFHVNCNTSFIQSFSAPISYPFRLDANPISVGCNSSDTTRIQMNGDLSPSAEWFVFVGVTAFLYALASIVFYVIFDAKVRTTHERLVTIGDLVGTVLYAFFWLTAASAWAWGLNEVKYWSGQEQFLQIPALHALCNAGGTNRCTHFVHADFGPLNASVAFAFLNFFLWSCNVWFVYKESPYHQEPAKDENPAGTGTVPPNTM